MIYWICDDLPASVRDLEKWIREDGEQVICFSDPQTLLAAMQSSKDKPDAVFMDIDFENQPEGFACAKALLKNNPELPVLFLTGYSDQYAQDVLLECRQAYGYLTKPLKKEIVLKYLARLKEDRNNIKQLQINRQGREILLPESIIYYVVSDNHRVEIHTCGGSYVVYEQLRAIRERLSEDFITCHKSYLVNLNYISTCSGTRVFLKNGAEIPISRRYHNEVPDLYHQHLQKKMMKAL